MTRLIAWMLALLTASTGYANVGVFTGEGHTVKLTTTANVRLVSEEVKIFPHRGRIPFDGSLKGMDQVEFICKFVLENLSDETVELQVGFPLTAGFFSPPYKTKESDVVSIVRKYKFIARDDEKTYHVRFTPYDTKKELAALFLWDMTFEPNQVRELHVWYEIPVSMSLVETRKRPIKYTKEWYSALERGLREEFGYVTWTGRSWNGPIRNAKFQVKTKEFERYLNFRGHIESIDADAEREFPSETRNRDEPFTAVLSNGNRFLVHRRITPSEFVELDGNVTWEFENWVPDRNIAFYYTLTHIPSSDRAVRALARNLFGDHPNVDDLEDLKEILMAS